MSPGKCRIDWMNHRDLGRDSPMNETGREDGGGGTEGIGCVHEKGKTTTTQSGSDTNLYKSRGRGRMTKRVDELRECGRMKGGE